MLNDGESRLTAAQRGLGSYQNPSSAVGSIVEGGGHQKGSGGQGKETDQIETSTGKLINSMAMPSSQVSSSSSSSSSSSQSSSSSSSSSSASHSSTSSSHAHGGMSSLSFSGTRLRDLFHPEFYRRENWIAEICEILFKIKQRGSSIQLEVYFGVIHFVSCLYCLAVIPQQLVIAGYAPRPSVVTTALCSGVGSIICGLVANLPFVIAPPTVVSIYLVVFLREENLTANHGNAAVILSGALLMLFGYKPLASLVGKLIPLPIQVGTSVGIGLLTALAGTIEIKLVQSGQYQILTRGFITPEVVIAISGFVIISAAIHYHMKGAFCFGLLICTFSWWLYSGDWPREIISLPAFKVTEWSGFNTEFTPALTGDMLFLYILYLTGITTSLSNLAGLAREGEGAPRARWVFLISGLMTVISGLLSGPPILVSPESAAGIKAGSKTGLSTLVCGLLFIVSLCFSPLFQHVPTAGTSPVLLMIGALLFQNVNRIDWTDIKDAAPAFCVLFFIPFMYSVVEGVTVGYYVFLFISLLTGDILHLLAEFTVYYIPSTAAFFEDLQQRGYISTAASRERGRGGSLFLDIDDDQDPPTHMLSSRGRGFSTRGFSANAAAWQTGSDSVSSGLMGLSSGTPTSPPHSTLPSMNVSHSNVEIPMGASKRNIGGGSGSGINDDLPAALQGDLGVTHDSSQGKNLEDHPVKMSATAIPSTRSIHFSSLFG